MKLRSEERRVGKEGRCWRTPCHNTTKKYKGVAECSININYKYVIVFFFFQAEDGIRDGHVTGVQTCALPISAEVLVSRALDDLAHGDYHAARVAALSAKQRATFAREASLSVQAR